MCSVSAAFLACMPAYAQPRAQDAGPALNEQQLEQEFQTASTEYGSGHFTEAATRLEKLLLAAPRVFEVHELLALTYSAESLDSKANGHFEAAVRLKPGSAAARINLAANLVRLSEPAEAEQQFKEALKLEPGNFEANHDLGEFYIQRGRISDAAPFLERAQKIDASSYDNGFDLALADLQMQKLPEAGQLVHDLLKKKETAELHNLLAQIEEKSGSFVDAANEYEMAAHMDASESNLFDWGSELLLHRTLEPAIEVFRRATELFPNSPRLAIGYGIALYSRGHYDDAVTALIRAADLGPADARCYMFLSKAYDSSPSHADEVIERFRRFSQLQPRNGRAFYYYAISLWKGKRTQDANVDLAQIESLLKKAVTLDSSLAEAHLQLGNLYSDQSKYAESIPEYQQALERNPDLADAHYRLGQALVHTGDKSRAQEQFQVYQQLRAQQTADLDKQRAEIRQFVYSEQNVGAEKR